jgi:formylglycine-generating enzyme required for sulfatase activity
MKFHFLILSLFLAGVAEPLLPHQAIKRGVQAVGSGPIPRHIRENPRDRLKYVWVPPGTFMMGCSPGDFECDISEVPTHQVTITKGFWIGQTDVTVGAYRRFARFSRKSMPPAPDVYEGWTSDNMPVVDVTWDDAQAYCGWLEGRLPTEAEWEYAARGGSAADLYGNLDEIAWHRYNSEGTAHEVAQKRPNGFVLYDMLGNVWQWVNDVFDSNYYARSPSQDPQGPPNGPWHVLRGGSWSNNTVEISVSVRRGADPTYSDSQIGFRCVKDIFKP